MRLWFFLTFFAVSWTVPSGIAWAECETPVFFPVRLPSSEWVFRLDPGLAARMGVLPSGALLPLRTGVPLRTEAPLREDPPPLAEAPSPLRAYDRAGVFFLEYQPNRDQSPLVLARGAKRDDTYLGSIEIANLVDLSGSLDFSGGAFLLTQNTDFRVANISMGGGVYLQPLVRGAVRAVTGPYASGGSVESSAGVSVHSPGSTPFRFSLLSGPDFVFKNGKFGVLPAVHMVGEVVF